jgi:hypothetical protein
MGVGVKAHFREADLKRALNALARSECRAGRVDVAVDGTISIIIGAGATPKPARRNSWDDVIDQ